MEPMSELERRHIEEQLGGVRAELRQLRQLVEVYRELLRHEQRAGLVSREQGRSGIDPVADP